MRDIERLIVDAFAGRALSEAEVQAIANHIAGVGFDPAYRIAAGTQVVGREWQGHVLTARTRLPSGEQHYLKHVQIQHEWPLESTLDAYYADGARLAGSPESGIFVNNRAGRPKIGIIGLTPRQSLGTAGHEWTLLEYHVKARHWVTLFQIVSIKFCK